jgi:hypothetical protein
MALRKDGLSDGEFRIRAKGQAEFAPAQFQVRTENSNPWPKFWLHTNDLAGLAGRMGYDTKDENKDKTFQQLIMNAFKKKGEGLIFQATDKGKKQGFKVSYDALPPWKQDPEIKMIEKRESESGQRIEFKKSKPKSKKSKPKSK